MTVGIPPESNEESMLEFRCTECFTEVLIDSAYCPNCGRELDDIKHVLKRLYREDGLNANINDS